jgi:hypothetical protein
MALNTVSLVFGYYPDPTQGRPVFNGSIFIGEPDLDPTILANQKTITIRQEGVDTPSVPQPISTSAGGVPVFNGSPAEILVEGSYSIAVLNAQDTQVYYVAEASTEGSYNQGGTGAISRTVTSRLQDLVSLFDFMTTTQISDVKAGTLSVDVIGAVQSALDSGESLWAPSGKYLCSAPPTITNSGTALFGAGTYKAEFITNFAAGDSFLVTGGAGEIKNIQLANFRVDSSVAKTSGAGIRLFGTVRSTLNNVVAGGQDGNDFLWDGYHFDEVDLITMNGYQGSVLNDALIVNGGGAGRPRGSDIYTWGGKLTGGGVGVRIGGDVGGLYLDAVDINNNDVAGVVIDQTQQASGNRQIFMGAGCFIDGESIASVRQQPGIVVNDPGLEDLMLTGTWLSVHTIGMHIQAASPTFTRIKINGGNNMRCDDDGIRIDTGVSVRLLQVNDVDFNDITGWGVNSIDSQAGRGDGEGVLIGASNRFRNCVAGDVTWDTIPPLAGTSIQRQIGDDAVFSFAPRDLTTLGSSGLILVDRINSGNHAFFYYRAESGGSATTDVNVVGMTITTGVLTGTTGVDGAMTVSAHTDEKIYIENRLGGNVTVSIQVIAAHPGATVSGPVIT